MTRFRTETGSAPSGSEGIREDRERLRADNAALKQQLDVMRALAFRDQLTGLFSRHYLTDYLEQEIERMSGEANIVLALCDIDDFKLISDDLGDFSCTLTCGLSAYDPELTFGENFASADRALYHGKETGKNRCVFAQSNQIERDGGNRS